MKLSRSRAGRVPAKLIIIIVAALVLALIVSSYFFLLRPGPEQIVRQFLMAEAMQDYNTMAALSTAKVAALINAQKDKLPEPDQNPNIPEMDIGKAEIKGSTAYVPVTTKGPSIPGLTYGRQEETQRVVVVKEGGKWKVDPLATYAASQGPPEGMGAPPMGGGPPGMETMPPGGP